MSSRLLFGQGGPTDPPALWAAAPIVTDGGVAWGVLARLHPIAPAGFGGECRFVALHLVVTHSLGAVLRVTPLVDADALRGSASSVSTPLGTVSMVPVLVTLPQQGAPYTRITRTLTIPLLQRLTNDSSGVEETRQSPRGAQCAVLIESVGALGTGELFLDGAELEFEPVRKATFEPVTTG